MEDSERDQRTPLQWLKSILAYLEYQSGDSWRRLSDPAHRWNPDRLWYVDGIRTIRTLMASPGSLPQTLSPKKPVRSRPARIASPRRRREDRVA
jgi:hypothetical protein